MKVLIIEDEQRAASHLKRLLNKISPDISVTASLESISDAVDYLKQNNNYDFIFSDIQLADGLCFEIFRQVRINCPIVFTTAYDHYAMEAFNTNGIDYLLKPVEEQRLIQAIEKVKNLALAPSMEKIFALAKIINRPQYKSRFLVKAGDKIKTIHVEEISAFYSLDKGSWLHTKSNRDYLTDLPLDQLEQLLDPDKFFRINRRYIISADSCTNINAWSNSRLKITIEGIKDNDIVVARERVQNFKEWLDK